MRSLGERVHDRLLHRAAVLNIDGESYRMRTHRARVDKVRRALGGRA